jgi:hypothetical protein
MEHQFVDCLQQIKTLGEEKRRHQKELDDLKAAAQELVEMVDPREDGAEDEPPQPDLPRPYHLLPSTAAAAEKAKTTGNESTESSRPNERRAQANNSSGSSVEWSDDAPLIPRRRREM